MQVIIVGAGPAGATTALLFARSGVEVTLVEREASFERVFRGEGLMPSGVDALLQMGLAPVLASIPSRPVTSWNIYIDGREVFVIPEPAEELGDRAMRVVAQPAFLEHVLELAGRCPSFHFERGVRVHDLVRDAAGRVAGVRLEGPAGAYERRADLVIGCDGRGSLSWRFTFARYVAPVLGRYRWAQRAWLDRQHDLRFGSTEVRLRV